MQNPAIARNTTARAATARNGLLCAGMLAFGLLAAESMAQTTHTVGTPGGDFADLAAAMASASVVAGDTLLLNPANNGGNTFAPATINKGVTILGEDGAAIVGANWFLGPVSSSEEIFVRDLEVSGAVGNNGVVVNGDDTTVTLDKVVVADKPNFGLNINAGLVNVINGSSFLNNGGAGISMGGPGVVNITGTAEEPIIVAGNGGRQDAVQPVQRAGLSARQLFIGSRQWNVEHVEVSGSPYGFVNQDGNVTVEDIDFQNVTFSDISLSAIRIFGENVSIDYDIGSISGRTTPHDTAMEELDFALVYQSGDENTNTFTGSNLTFAGGDYGMRLRNDSGPMVVSNSTLTGGFGELSGVFAGGGGVTLENCTIQSSNSAIMIGVGGTEEIRLVNPVFNGPATPVPFWLQGLEGEFIIEGTDPENKVNLDMDGVVVLIRNWGGTTTVRNVTATTNGGLFDCFGMGALASPVTLNIEQSAFHGPGGIVTMQASEPSVETVTINATNTIWRGTYTPTAYVLSVNDATRTAPGTVNLVHCTVAPAATAAVVINADAPSGDVIESDASIFDASGAGALVASTVELQGQRNLSYSIGGATANGGWVNGFPEDTIIADPLLETNGELTAASPAINAAGGSTMTVDYRGTARPQGENPDIGAHEFIDVVMAIFEGFQIF